jgi:transcriptional regulator with XRE-family HTH domain
MNICEAFKQTLEHFTLSQKQIASESGVRQETLSRWLNGKQQINDDTLDQLISALPKPAQQYLFLNRMVGSMDDMAVGQLLYAISLKMRGDALEKISA